MLAIVMPAAGASARMGGPDKLMQPVGGVPLLIRQVRRALATGAPVFVTIRADRPARVAALQGLAQPGLACVNVPTPDEGIAASLRAGVAALPERVSKAMILLPDLPDIDTDDLCAMITAHQARPHRVLRGATEDGAPGHPVIFPRSWFARLMGLSGDAGAGTLLCDDTVTLYPLGGTRARTDLDSPADWAAWNAKNGI